MKLFKKILGFRNYRLASYLPWLALAGLLWLGNLQPVVADSPDPGKTLAQAKVQAPAKFGIKVLTQVPVKVPVKSRIKVLAQAPVKAPVTASTAQAPVIKVAVPKVEGVSIAQTGFGFSQAAENLKATVDFVMLILGNEYFQKNATARRRVLWEILSERIDFERMARRSLAGEWATRTPQEKKQFVRLFKKLLERSYVRWIEGFKNGRVHYLSERVKGKYAKVQTRIFVADQFVDVEYKLVRQKNGWRVYDFTVQGVSVVRNYRAQFARVLDRESYQALVKKLKAQVG